MQRMHFRLLAVLITCAAVAVVHGQVVYETQKILADDGAAGDEFGYAVVLGEGLLAVGAVFDDNKGSVGLYDVHTGARVRKVVANDGGGGDFFGHAVAIEGNILVVGAPHDDDRGGNAGAAYIINLETFEQTKIYASDAAGGDEFGAAIDMDSGVIVVSASSHSVGGIRSGAAYLFDATTGAQLHRLLPADGASGDLFSVSLAIDEGLVVVGAFADDSRAGAAYLFDAETGVQQRKILPDIRRQGDLFGFAVDLYDGLVVVGAYGGNSNGFESGAAYVFRASDGAQIIKLVPDDGESGDLFGRSVAIGRDYVIAGARDDADNGTDSGSAYRYRIDRENLNIQLPPEKLLTSDGMPGDHFSQSLTLRKGIAAIGAIHDDDNGNNSGSVYVFGECEPDLTDDGMVDTLDFLLFLGAFASGDPLADWNSDGQINTLDFLAYLNDWVAGC